MRMREIFAGSRTEKDEKGIQLRFDYYILVGEMDVGRFFCESYGVKVTQRGTPSLCAIPDVTTSAARIDSLMELLMKNGVTPISLPEVVQDWL